MSAKQIETTQDQKLHEVELSTTTEKAFNSLEVGTEKHQEIWGFGQTFNELGAVALQNLSEEKRNEILDDLFTPKGMNYNICRIPVGASDYALNWYSADETTDDYDLADFSIERDKKYLLPYVKAAQKRNPDIVFSISPWSPPTWMKSHPVYNYGILKHDPKVQQAYADYFVKFCEAYEKEGVHISWIFPQNEPQRDQKFPSCYWTGEELRDFIKNYLGPTVEKPGLKDTQIWLGTVNSPLEDTEMTKDETTDYPVIAETVLSDPDAYKYVKGVTYQWAGKSILQRTVHSFPELGYLQSESECGNGDNTWTYAEYVFNLFRHYIENGVNGYMYWNSVLQGGSSTWGWLQNSMISVDADKGIATKNPEYYVMRHYAHYIQHGAHLVDYTGHLYGESTAYENPDGSVVVVMSNSMNHGRDITVTAKGQTYKASVKAHSFNTFVFD